jgi:Holliday junction resolvase
MKNIDDIVKHADRSEKSIERYLCKTVEHLGGVCLKYSNANTSGYPDRVALLPGGVTVWVELKSTGKSTTKLQRVRIAQLAKIGHYVYVADSKEKINAIMEDLGYDL